MDPLRCHLCSQLVDSIVDDEADPGRGKHVVHEVVLVEAPVVAHFADLVPLQVVVVVH